jgi:glutathione S-transferase
MEFFQAEWCPHSHRVRQRLTELGLDFRARQVAADPGEREELRRIAGTDEIPVLVVAGEEPRRGEEAILAFLEQFRARPDAGAHRAKAREEVPSFDEVAGRAA